MEVENKYMMSNMVTSRAAEDEEEDDVALPGFRFHPTDEELVGFYLIRKVEKRPINMELIKHIDIYKYEPWDLPKSSNMGEKEWYFFCKRGRKYRNSIRPNRVTGSGFWKATGIDKPIYSSAARHECIGLKKSLVYYRGSAGKGTKTDWMMHEFRLPAQHDKSTKHIDANTVAQEAEVWTVCRIFKRNSTYKNKWLPTEWRAATTRKPTIDDTITSSVNSSNSDYIISFGSPAAVVKHNTEISKPFISGHVYQDMMSNQQQCTAQVPSSDLLKNVNYWDELRSILELDPY